jgi:hypothetical protein
MSGTPSETGTGKSQKTPMGKPQQAPMGNAPEVRRGEAREARMDQSAGRVSEIGPVVDRLELILDGARDSVPEGNELIARGEALRELHARVRTHHAVGVMHTPTDGREIAPRYVAELERLRDEHSVMIGSMDRLIRAVETLMDLALEDRQLFAARVRELIAFVRRHVAEEDRVLYLAMWHDFGGES